jgi:hypothetical protein
VLDPGKGRGIGGDWFVAPFAFVRAGHIWAMVRLMFFEELVTVAANGDRLSDRSSSPLSFEIRYQF